jgi:hypothetical protein
MVLKVAEKSGRPLLAAALLLMLAAGSARAQQTQPAAPARLDVVGKVVDQTTGRPLAGARVELYKPTRVVLTDENGAFRIPEVPAGAHLLNVQRLGYQETGVTIAVGEGNPALTIGIEPKAITIEGLNVAVDRMKRRRNSYGVSVRAFEGKDLLLSTASNAEEFLRSRMALGIGQNCPNDPFRSRCYWIRGQLQPISVYIDDRPTFGGLEDLTMYRPSELYAIEVFSGGRSVRAYSNWYMERVGARFAPMMPVF